MFGCLRRVGCVVILALLLVGAWYWYARVPTSASRKTSAAGAPANWQPLSTANAERGRRAVESLGARSGPVFANLSASDAASFIFLAAARQLPPTAQNVSAAVIGDRLYVRGFVSIKELGAADVVGPLASLLGDRDTLQLGGVINVIQPGLGQFRVRDVRFGRLDVPPLVIPKLIARIRKGQIPPGIADDAFPMPLPPYISDVRIADGRITVYKNTQ
jgi:hypothetical protein